MVIQIISKSCNSYITLYNIGMKHWFIVSHKNIISLSESSICKINRFIIIYFILVINNLMTYIIE